MNRKSLPTLLGSSAVWLVAGVLIYAGLSRGYDPVLVDIFRVLIGFCLVTLGDLLEIDLRGGRATSVSKAVVFALFVVFSRPLEVLLVVVPAMLVALVLKSREVGWGPRFRSTSRRLAIKMVALGVYLVLSSLIPPLPVAEGELLSKTVAMLLAGSLYLLLDTAASAGFIALAQKIPFMPIWRGQLKNLTSLHVAFLSVSALMALAHGVLREWAFVLFLLPLFAARYSFRRYSSIHSTYTQTIRALSQLPAMAGYGEPGHSVRVAELASTVGRHYGLPDNEVQDLEFAGLLHDIGLLSFEDQVLGLDGRPMRPEAAEVAEASSGIIEQTPYLERVAQIVAGNGGPPALGLGRDTVSIASRILKVAHAYVEAADDGATPDGALQEIESRAGKEYDLTAVICLRRVLDYQAQALLGTLQSA